MRKFNQRLSLEEVMEETLDGTRFVDAIRARAPMGVRSTVVTKQMKYLAN